MTGKAETVRFHKQRKHPLSIDRRCSWCGKTFRVRKPEDQDDLCYACRWNVDWVYWDSIWDRLAREDDY